MHEVDFRNKQLEHSTTVKKGVAVCIFILQQSIRYLIWYERDNVIFSHPLFFQIFLLATMQIYMYNSSCDNTFQMYIPSTSSARELFSSTVFCSFSLSNSVKHSMLRFFVLKSKIAIDIALTTNSWSSFHQCKSIRLQWNGTRTNWLIPTEQEIF